MQACNLSIQLCNLLNTASEFLKQLCYLPKLRLTHYIQLLNLANNSSLYQITPDSLKDGLNCEITQQTMPKPWIQTRLLTSFTFKPYTSQTVGEGRNEARESRMKQKRGAWSIREENESRESRMKQKRRDWSIREENDAKESRMKQKRGDWSNR